MAHPYIDCLKKAAAAKDITEGQMKKAEARFDGLTEEYIADGLNPIDAANKAADEATETFRVENIEQKRRKINSLRASIKMWRDVQSFKGSKKSKAWRGFFDTYDNAPYENYSSIKDGVRGHLQNEMDNIIHQYKNKLGGIYRPTKDMEDVLREIFNENTGNANAKQLADAWKKASERAREMFRAAGGSIREMPDWRISQSQDYLKLVKAGKEKWVDDHLQAGVLDWDKVRRSDGRRIRGEDARRKFLEEAYETLATDGANKIDLSKAGGHKNFTNKLANHRVLHYANSQAWKMMHEQYGSGSVFDVMMQHMDDMAHEIAMMQRFGPSPNVAIDNLAAMMKKVDPIGADGEIKALKEMEQVVQREVGLARTNGIGHAMAGQRNLLTAALLGGASTIAIPSDLNLARTAMRFNKLDDMKFIRRYVRLMNPANDADRRLAIRVGFVADNVSAQMYGARRYLGSIGSGPAWTRRFADITMNMSLLTPHTQMARWAYGMEMLGLFADHKGKSLDELPFADMLRRGGITSEEWDRFRSVPDFVDADSGANFLRPDDIIEHYGMDTDNLALMSKFKSMVMDEVSIAIPDNNLNTRQRLVGATQPGSLIGEVARSVAMFKNFPVTFATLISGRYSATALREKGAMGAAGYMTYLLTSLTAIGALRIQMTNVMNGRDPEDMSKSNFVTRAMVQGGGLGIYGDFFLADHNRFGGGPFQTAIGPPAQFMGDTAGIVQNAVTGNFDKLPKEMVEYAQRYTPGSRNWWSRLLTDRLIWENLIKWTDEDAAKSFERKNNRREKKYGTTSWWESGESRPERAPSIENILGE